MHAVSAQPFQLTQSTGKNPSIRILRVSGPITHATSLAFQDAIRAISSPNLIIDLSDVPSLDSMAIGILVRAYVFCNKAGWKLALVGLNHRVSNVLRLTGVDSLFDRYSTLSEAESALTK
jgi:anti-sigma B factor antagonist